MTGDSSGNRAGEILWQSPDFRPSTDSPLPVAITLPPGIPYGGQSDTQSMASLGKLKVGADGREECKTVGELASEVYISPWGQSSLSASQDLESLGRHTSGCAAFPERSK